MPVKFSMPIVVTMLLVGCARHDLPIIDFGDDGKGSALNGRDGGSKHGDDDDDGDGDDTGDGDEPDPSEGDGDGDGDGDGTDDPGHTEPDAGTADPNKKEPSPGNAPGCPKTAPNKFELTPCIKDQAIQCVYGSEPDYNSYVCNCYVASWYCT